MRLHHFPVHAKGVGSNVGVDLKCKYPTAHTNSGYRGLQRRRKSSILSRPRLLPRQPARLLRNRWFMRMPPESAQHIGEAQESCKFLHDIGGKIPSKVVAVAK